MTSFFALYGREAPILPEFQNGKTKVDEVEKDMIRRKQIIKKLQETLKRAQANMKTQVDKHGIQFKFHIDNLGDGKTQDS